MPNETPNAAQHETPVERLRSLLPQVFAPQKPDGELFVQLQIAPQMTVSMPLASISEVTLVTASEVTPIPNMPDAILGLFNTKGYVFWLIDLAHFLGLSSTLSQFQRYEMIMVHTDSTQNNKDSIPNLGASDQFLGLAVQHVQGSFRRTSSEIQRADTEIKSRVAPELVPYTNAYFWQDQKPLPILDVGRIKNKLVEREQYI